MIITIDGPTASGKTTIARLLAQKLNYFYLSSGLLFRGLAHALVHDFLYSAEQLKNPREQDIAKILAPQNFVYSYDPRKGERLVVNDKNVTQELRGSAISQYASIIGTDPLVRSALFALQHQIAGDNNVVAEGRDMGSAIFPHATVKFFLTASLEIRALRWQFDQKAKGKEISLKEALDEVKMRDERDANRTFGPLCVPHGAFIIDDSGLDKQQVLELMMREIEKLSHTS